MLEGPTQPANGRPAAYTHVVTFPCPVQSRAEPLPEEHVRFYAAAVILGLEYMQNHDLVWR